MKRQIASFLLAGIFCTKLLASGGSIAGRVAMNESEHGEPIIGAVVLLQGTVRGTTTNSFGQFRLTDIPPGRYTLIVSMVGYQKLTRSDVTVEEGEETFLKVIKLDPEERKIGLSLRAIADSLRDGLPSEDDGEHGRKRRRHEDEEE